AEPAPGVDWKTMTERKPAGQSWETWIDEQIREAREAGAFDNLPGAGKPLADLRVENDPEWWAKKPIKHDGNTDPPPALELRRKLRATLDGLSALRDEREVRRVLEALNAEIRKVNATVTAGPSTTLAPLDIDEIVREWRGRTPA